MPIDFDLRRSDFGATLRSLHHFVLRNTTGDETLIVGTPPTTAKSKTALTGSPVNQIIIKGD
tara:strand:+ start:705 stop:890 length:186 start_codon:yes stop_codon:yes gene_type:complete